MTNSPNTNFQLDTLTIIKFSYLRTRKCLEFWLHFITLLYLNDYFSVCMLLVAFISILSLISASKYLAPFCLAELWQIAANFAPIFQSQLEFSLTSGPADQGISVSQADSKAVKVPHSSQLGKSTPGPKVLMCSYVGLG